MVGVASLCACVWACFVGATVLCQCRWRLVWCSGLVNMWVRLHVAFNIVIVASVLSRRYEASVGKSKTMHQLALIVLPRTPQVSPVCACNGGLESAMPRHELSRSLPRVYHYLRVPS